MAKKSIKKNYIYNILYQLLTLIIPLITTPYVSRVLGADGVGTASYAESITSYFTLFATMGMTTFGQREISYVQNNYQKRTQIFWETKLLQTITTILVVVVYVLFSFHQNNPTLYLVLVFNIISVLADVSWFFQGLEEFGLIIFRNVILKIVNILFIFLFVREKNDLILYVFGITFFTFLANMSLWMYLPKYIGLSKMGELHPFRHLPTVIALFIPSIAIQIYGVLDKTLIGVITKDTFESGYYQQAQKISNVALAIITSLGTVMIPRVGFYYENKNIDEVKRLMYRGYHFVWFLGIPLCFGIMVVSENLVPWFFGDGYEKVAVLLKIVSLLILVIGINTVTGRQYMIPTKRENLYTITVIAGAGTNLILNLFLIYFFKSIGAAIASVIAETVIAIFQLWLVRKELSSIRVLREGGHYYFAGAIMALVLWLISKNMEASIINTAIIVILGAAIYFAVLLWLKDEFFINNVKTIIQGLKGKMGRN